MYENTPTCCWLTLLVLYLAANAIHPQGRLSQEEIERMVQEAEDFSEEDRLVKERTGAKNSFESYLYNMKNVLDDEEGGVASQISDADKQVNS